MPKLETALPVTVLAGEALYEDVGDSLGETLKHQIGLNSASFGPAVGQPVIRGQTARRVMVLQNSVGVTDVAAFSPDHVNAVEAILAERIEVVRGPSTLLYGSGAIGGVVNVIDNRVPESLPDQTQFSLRQTSNSVNSGANTAVQLDAATGNFAFHVSAYRRDNDNVEIKGFAIDEVAVEALEELVAEHLEEEGHHEEEEGHEEDHDEEEVEVHRLEELGEVVAVVVDEGGEVAHRAQVDEEEGEHRDEAEHLQRVRARARMRLGLKLRVSVRLKLRFGFGFGCDGYR